jgi:hypothetical protein
MPRWLRHIVELIGLLFAWVTGRKYETLAKRMGRQGEEQPRPDVKRFIIVQIDGLAHDYLLQALSLGYVPTLQRFIAQGHRLQRWRCGLPSSTPAVQAGLMYGDNWDIPAFRWYEKDTRLAPHCKSPFFAARIKARIGAGRPGILTGGSSYTNLLDGDARLALFTLSSMGRHRFFEHLRGLGWAFLFALIPWRIIRILALVLWELVRDVLRTLGLWVRSGFRQRFTLVQPVLQVLTNVVFGEIQTFGVLLDIYRGIPAIYVNFYGYDEVAHHDGPLGGEALRALRRIDGYIRQIDRIRRTYWPETELYICSDHGMTPAIPLRRIDPKKPLGQFVAECVRTSVVWDESRGRAGWGNIEADISGDSFRWLMDEMGGIEAHLSGRSRRLAGALRTRLDKRLPSDGLPPEPEPDANYDFTRGADVVVRASGNLAHLYFNVSPERMDVSEIAILYPDLVDALNDHPGIGLVLGREGGRPVVVSSRGTAGLTPEWLPPNLPEPEQSCEDLARLLAFPHTGDLVLVGAWNTFGRIVTFEEQLATHGGIGGPQDYPFFLTPPHAPLDVTRVTSATQLYPYFMERYHGRMDG